MKAAVILGIAAAAATPCDLYFKTGPDLWYWNLTPLAAQTFKAPQSDFPNAMLYFNVCSNASYECPNKIPSLPAHAPVVQTFPGGDGTDCVRAAGSLFRIWPVNVQNPKAGGLLVEHDVTYEPLESPQNCKGYYGVLPGRSTTYQLSCDPTADKLTVTGAAEVSQCRYWINATTKLACAQALPCSGEQSQ